MVDKHDAVGVVNFVLENACQKAFGGNTELAAGRILGTDAHFVIAGNLAVYVRHAEAAFIIFLYFTLVLGNDRIDEYRERFVIFVVKIVTDDDDTQRLVDLDRGEGDTNFVLAAIFPIDGRRLHIFDELRNFGGDNADFFRSFAEVLVGQGDNVVFGHVPSSIPDEQR